MAGLYDDISDDDLVAQIRELRDARRTLAMGGGVVRVQAENRRMIEYVPSTAGQLITAMRDLMTEAARRNLDIACGVGGAILVEIG